MPENPFKDAEDKLLFAKTLDKFNSARKKGEAFTDFLDPFRCAAFTKILAANREISVAEYGGFENAERKMLGFFTENASDEFFPITPITFTYNEKFSKPPSHRDYLGSVLGLGLERGKIGDIRIGESGAILYVSSDISEYICENLNQVKRTVVKGKIGETLQIAESQNIEKRITVPSLRADAVISSALNLSRGKVVTLFESQKVFINWKPAKKTQTLTEGDAITIRGLGRLKLNSIEGNTKKDRIILQITI
ncbi:MAG: YlmH/Sll1252 family protein [Defluviitaleaceae bacterium]|nr:YlmH/Sll1252 family protein [Defluviitaleaceae bacterium]